MLLIQQLQRQAEKAGNAAYAVKFVEIVIHLIRKQFFYYSHQLTKIRLNTEYIQLTEFLRK